MFTVFHQKVKQIIQAILGFRKHAFEPSISEFLHEILGPNCDQPGHAQRAIAARTASPGSNIARPWFGSCGYEEPNSGGAMCWKPLSHLWGNSCMERHNVDGFFQWFPFPFSEASTASLHGIQIHSKTSTLAIQLILAVIGKDLLLEGEIPEKNTGQTGSMYIVVIHVIPVHSSFRKGSTQLHSWTNGNHHKKTETTAKWKNPQKYPKAWNAFDRSLTKKILCFKKNMFGINPWFFLVVEVQGRLCDRRDCHFKNLVEPPSPLPQARCLPGNSTKHTTQVPVFARLLVLKSWNKNATVVLRFFSCVKSCDFLHSNVTVTQSWLKKKKHICTQVCQGIKMLFPQTKYPLKQVRVVIDEIGKSLEAPTTRVQMERTPTQKFHAPNAWCGPFSGSMSNLRPV